MPGTILLGIDIESANESAAGYARYGADFFREMNVPVTWFICGNVLEKYPDSFRPLVGDPMLDLQSHTYSHLLLKTVVIQVPKGRVVHGKRDWYLQPGASPAQVDADLTKCQNLFADILGKPATALTTPWGYYRGLADHPDLLEIVRRHGFKAIRCFARDEYDGQPVPLEWQPFFYKAQGYPEILETLVQGYQDDFYWEQFGRSSPEETYWDCLVRFTRRAAMDDLVWSVGSHDHGCATKEGFERKGAWLRKLINYALDLNVRFLTVTQYYEEMIAKREAGDPAANRLGWVAAS